MTATAQLSQGIYVLPAPLPEKEDSRKGGIVKVGIAVLRKESAALMTAINVLNNPKSELHVAFKEAVKTLVNRTGRVVIAGGKQGASNAREISHRGRVAVTGMGKSGHVAHKMAATLASTGTPAFFVHPAEASHGDLGMISTKDVVIALSNSGKTRELNAIVDYTRYYGIPLIAITSNRDGPLAKAADIKLVLPQFREACVHGLAPTTSTTLTMALGDALAISAMNRRGFTPQDFGAYHPGGSLGNALQNVAEIMHKGLEVPIVERGDRLPAIVTVMMKDNFGCVGVVDKSRKLVGVITNDDVSQQIAYKNEFNRTAQQIMSPSLIIAKPGMRTSEAQHLMDINKISQLFVVNKVRRPVGIVHARDLLKARAA